MSGAAKSRFVKPWLSCQEQVELLASRGLTIVDKDSAERFLFHFNYYRFSGYCPAFESARHIFISGTTFEQICAAYSYDMVLRDLLNEALEVVEIDFRAVIAHRFGQQYGAFGHCNASNFHRSCQHSDLLEKVQEEATRSKNELFVRHFKDTYAEFPDLPIWMLTEVVSFGCLSKMFGGMRAVVQGNIAGRYGLQAATLESLMHHFSYVRNLCAHHSRLWDRKWAIKPALPVGKSWSPPNDVDNRCLFATLLLLCAMMNRIPAVAEFLAAWKQRVSGHISNPPTAPNALTKMGFNADWQRHPIWTA